MNRSHLSMALFAGVLLFSSAARAERWFDMGTNTAVRPEFASTFAACVDLDSVKTAATGWTSYHWKLCTDTQDLFEAQVQCGGDFTAEQIPIRQRTITANNKLTPQAPWKTTDTYLSSMAGKMAALACQTSSAKPPPSQATPKPY
jgi:hypothetical protein